MKLKKRILLGSLLGTVIDCSSIEPESDFVQARVLGNSCAGTVLQFIDTTSTVGKKWAYFIDLKGPHSPNDSKMIYKKCVNTFDVPANRIIPGDTLEFTYRKKTEFNDPICALNFGVDVFISIQTVK